MHKSDLKHDNYLLQQKLESIYQLRRTRSKVNWDRGQYLELLEAFGNPHLNLPPVIHVAGTNGKGSVIAILRSILEAQGLKVHCYTSPHLINVNERIYLGGRDIDNAYLEQLIDQALYYNKDAPLSFFEITTALAFKAFSERPADILLLEVGMGGRLDCTNVINDPIATIINRVSLDHAEFLGCNVVDIAKEKAGIMKEGVPCVLGYQGDSEVITTLENEVLLSNSIAVQWDIERNNDAMCLSYNDKKYEFPLPALQGAHQVQNAGVAIVCLLSIADKIKVLHDAMCKGLQYVKWLGRLQNIEVDGLETDIWLDCGHNDSAGEALAKQVGKWKDQDGKALHLIIGMLDRKDEMGFLTPLLPLIEDIHIVPISSEPNSKNKDDLAGIACNVYEYGNVIEAIKSISASSPLDRILIAGSVYLVGEVLKYIND